MAVTPSRMLELGTPLPSFTLPDTVADHSVSSDALRDAPLVVMFICNHCPFVVHLRSALAEFGRECASKGVQVIAISSNDVTTHPADAPDKMKVEARKADYTFPYLYDESQEVARAFQAACTPDFYLFDRHSRLVYRGQFDASRPGNAEPITGADLRAAVDAVVAGAAPPMDQKPSIGCNIKWKSTAAH